LIDKIIGTITYVKNELEWLKKKEIQDDPSFQELANLTINRCIENIKMFLDEFKEVKEMEMPKHKINIIRIPKDPNEKPIIMREMKAMMNVNGKNVDTMIRKDAMKKPSEYKYEYELNFRKKVTVEITGKKFHFDCAKIFTDTKMHPKFIKKGEIEGIPYIAKIYKINIIIYGFKKEENGKRYAYLIGSKKLGDYLK